MRSFHSVFVFIILLVLYSCGGSRISSTSVESDGDTVTDGHPVSDLVFLGIDSVDQITATTARINWTAVVGASGYEVYNVTSGTIVFLETIIAPASNHILTGLTVDTTYVFRIRVKDSLGQTDDNIEDKTFITVNDTSAPTAPSGLSLNSPASSPGNDSTLTVTISGVVSGDTVTIFKDEGDGGDNCDTSVGSATASDVTIDITTSILIDGSHTFYATSSNALLNTSPCSTASIVYELDTVAPLKPSSIDLSDPVSSPGIDSTPSFVIEGVVSGDTVKLYSDSCITEVATNTASATTITLTSLALTGDNEYYFHAKTLDTLGNTDGCSLVTKLYDLDTSFTFSGISSISPKTDSSATINWAHIASAIRYDLYNTSAGIVYITSVLAPTATYKVTGLSANTVYHYRVKAVKADGTVDTNLNDVSVTTDNAPATPTGLTLQTGVTLPNLDDTPTITVSGVKTGDTVKIFSDDTCGIEIGSAVTSGTSVDIISDALGDASYNIYANSAGENTSACSTANVVYEVNSFCPSGYIPIPADSSTKAYNGFCVMKYEAKNDGSDNAISQEDTTPWSSISRTNAQIECTNLGVNYDLISNPEWMAIARNIENIDSNWTGGAVGSGCIKRGNIGNTYNCSGGASAYNGDNPEFGVGRDTLASHILDNGEVIWDISGNVDEWIDWTLGGGLSADFLVAEKAYFSGDGEVTVVGRSVNIVDIDGSIMVASELWPEDVSFNSDHGTGKYSSGTTTGAPMRGGNHSSLNSGIFNLETIRLSSQSNALWGFRCVYRPSP